MSRRIPPVWLALLSVILAYGFLGVLVVRLLGLGDTFPAPVALARVSGALFVVLGMWLLGWAIHHLSLRRAFGREIYAPPSDSTLVTTGPFAYVRNPLYLGAAIALVGWTLFLRSTILVVVTPLMLVHFALVARWEARELSSRLGPRYEAYRRATPSFIPRRPPRTGRS